MRFAIHAGIAKRLLTTISIVGALAGFSVVGTQPASAEAAASSITPVRCDRPDYLRITVHSTGGDSSNKCFAQKGDYPILFHSSWVTQISTGNNRVQWLGDGKWQPATPIAKNTLYYWPNTPGGVRIDAVRII